MHFLLTETTTYPDLPNVFWQNAWFHQFMVVLNNFWQTQSLVNLIG